MQAALTVKQIFRIPLPLLLLLDPLLLRLELEPELLLLLLLDPELELRLPELDELPELDDELQQKTQQKNDASVNKQYTAVVQQFMVGTLHHCGHMTQKSNDVKCS